MGTQLYVIRKLEICIGASSEMAGFLIPDPPRLVRQVGLFQ